MCGVVHDGIVPGLWGYEAGQSGVGDIFAWFVDHSASRPPTTRRRASRASSLHEHLTDLAAAPARSAQHGLVALDWHSGNRSVLVDHELSGVIVGLDAAPPAPRSIYRALLEATAFGTRTIIEAFEGAGRARRRSSSSPAACSRTPFLHAAVRRRHAARRCACIELRPGAGARVRRCTPRWPPAAYPDIRAATAAMGKVRRAVYTPDAGARATPTTRCTRSTRRCTTTSAAARTTCMHRLRRDPARERGREDADVAARCAEEVCALHAELVRNDLVAWTSGNLSARVPGERPDGDQGRAASPSTTSRPRRWWCAISTATRVEGDLSPSSDTATHALRVPARCPTSAESRTRTARTPRPGRPAAEAIPCVLTAMADEFGGDDPGRPVRAHRRRGDRPRHRRRRSPAPLARGADAQPRRLHDRARRREDAIKAAVMCEDVARTVHLARVARRPRPARNREDIDALYDRYQNVYGQR